METQTDDLMLNSINGAIARCERNIADQQELRDSLIRRKEIYLKNNPQGE